jgi:hypothetical protein
MAFASASDHLDGDEFDLGELLLPHPETATVYRVPRGGPPVDGVVPGDLLVVERGRSPRPGEVVLLDDDGGLSLRRFSRMRQGASAVGEDGSDLEERLLGTATLLLRPLVPLAAIGT